jgi:hypothetical protein
MRAGVRLPNLNQIDVEFRFLPEVKKINKIGHFLGMHFVFV